MPTGCKSEYLCRCQSASNVHVFCPRGIFVSQKRSMTTCLLVISNVVPRNVLALYYHIYTSIVTAVPKICARTNSAILKNARRWRGR